VTVVFGVFKPETSESISASTISFQVSYSVGPFVMSQYRLQIIKRSLTRVDRVYTECAATNSVSDFKTLLYE